jgi:4-carboxymuconolactone decarboxylase
MKQDEQFFLVESDKLEQNLHALVRQQNLDMEESTRSLLTLAMVSANLQLDYVSNHVIQCAEAGLGRTDIAELLVQLYCYSGVYPCLASFKIAAQTFKDLEANGKLSEKQKKVENFQPVTTASDERIADGLEIRRRLFGSQSIDIALEKCDAFENVFNDLTHEFCFGNIWARPYFSPQMRSQICLAIASATAQHGAIGRHTRSALLGGVSKKRIAEIFFLAGIYGGLYNAEASFGVAHKIYTELKTEGWTDNS